MDARGSRCGLSEGCGGGYYAATTIADDAGRGSGAA